MSEGYGLLYKNRPDFDDLLYYSGAFDEVVGLHNFMQQVVSGYYYSNNTGFGLSYICSCRINFILAWMLHRTVLFNTIAFPVCDCAS